MGEFEKAKTLLEQANSILLTTHERTDGDDLGSVLALANYLKSVGKKVAVVISGGVPPQLQYLPLSEIVTENLPATQFDLLVISGCSVKGRVNHEAILELDIPTINLDHHPDNTRYADVNVVEPTKSAVAELTYDFFKFCGWEISHEIAICLLTGIVTDTGVFMHSNTQASTFSAAADLMEKGARVSTVTKHTYQGKDMAGLKAWSLALENAHYDPEKKMIYSIITESELAKIGNPPMSVFEGIPETLNKVPEAKFAMFLKQEDGLIKGSLRSEEHKGVDVQAIAKTLGGGGHKLAAGFSLYGTLAKNSQGQWEVV
ncbi:MAG TPA: bifunctional oligoribonuclease/PAP phosphatase NrnA [Patescibacteria group bacterium]|jgi:phosphoesterase RecJ-like protein|nr:bifunctional oligoribonuclease/PAP phosphatase NrnA [Patescibacteria group bacterium]